MLRFADGLGVMDERSQDDEDLSSEGWRAAQVEIGKTGEGRFWRAGCGLIWGCVNFEMPVKYPRECDIH